MSPLPGELEIPQAVTLPARIRPPGSKSITNRALAVAALADGDSLLTGALDSEDTRLMMQCLSALGISVEHQPENETIYVAGCGGTIPAEAAELFVGNSGTTVRFLTALASLGTGTYRLDGVPRMRQRPIGPLLEALTGLGADCISEAGTGCPPVLVRAAGLQGGKVRMSAHISSQFLSALLMAAPYARQNVTIEINGPLVSQPYVEMTLRVMEAFGVRVGKSAPRRFEVPAPCTYVSRGYQIEPDASAASYFFAAAAITGATITVDGLSHESLQGDVAFVELLKRMGCDVRYDTTSITVIGRPLQAIDADMTDISDTLPTLAVTALFARGTTVISGVAHVRHKETDRITAVAAELKKFGARVEEFHDGLKITPATDSIRSSTAKVSVETYDDHRMAMSFALAGLRIPGVVIRDPACVAKTYPRFFEDLLGRAN